MEQAIKSQRATLSRLQFNLKNDAPGLEEAIEIDIAFVKQMIEHLELDLELMRKDSRK